MFLEKYLNEFYFDMVLDNYEESYITLLDEKKFIKIYEIFKKYGFNYIDDIILKYLDIFMLDEDEVINGIISLKKELGENFVNIIGNDLTYLERIFDN